MSHIYLISGMHNLKLRGLIFPHKDELDLGLAMGVSGGGEIYVSRKSASALTLARMFAGVRDDDYDALRAWYLSVSVGMRNAFTLIDADGASYTVRWINDLLDWQKDADNRWSGTMRLRVENFEP
ncbi:MAG: hypothetical protein HY801_09665 [Candidatus Lindowbacteria bacterium]|nr:hypothetical protein [Candidatus Lindowbacteria bacterium]